MIIFWWSKCLPLFCYVVSFALNCRAETVLAPASHITESTRTLQICFDSHLLVVHDEEGVEDETEGDAGNSVEVNCVLLDLDIITFAISFFDFLLVVKHIFFADRYYGRVPEIVHWSQVRQEFVWVHSLNSTWYVLIESKHHTHPLHCLLIF